MIDYTFYSDIELFSNEKNSILSNDWQERHLAFKEIMDRHWGKFFFRAFRILAEGNGYPRDELRKDAEEVASDVLIFIWQNAKRVGAQKKPLAFLIGVTSKKAKNRRRKISKMKSREICVPEKCDGETPSLSLETLAIFLPDPELISRIAVWFVRELEEDLQPVAIDCLRRRSPKETADKLNVNVATIHRKKKIILERLRKKIFRDGGNISGLGPIN